MRDFGACWTHRSLVAPFITTVAPSEIFGDAAFRQAYEFGERCIWPARAARQSGDKGGDGRAVVPVEPPQVDIAGGAAGGAARPQEPIAGFDCRTEVGENSIGIRMAWRSFQAVTSRGTNRA